MSKAPNQLALLPCQETEFVLKNLDDTTTGEDWITSDGNETSKTPGIKWWVDFWFRAVMRWLWDLRYWDAQAWCHWPFTWAMRGHVSWSWAFDRNSPFGSKLQSFALVHCENERRTEKNKKKKKNNEKRQKANQNQKKREKWVPLIPSLPTPLRTSQVKVPWVCGWPLECPQNEGRSCSREPPPLFSLSTSVVMCHISQTPKAQRK